MVQRQGRAVGSNQYRERFVTIDDEARKAALESLGDIAIPRPTASAQTSRHGAGSLGEVASEHRLALDEHMAALFEPASANRGAAEMEARTLSRLRGIAAAEDDVLSRHPNLYGAAVMAANSFVVRAKHDPLLQEAIEAGDENATRVLSACDRLLEDVESNNLDAGGISQAIHDLEGGGEWSAMMTEDSQSSDTNQSEDMELCRRAAALSVASSRVSSAEEAEALQRELEKTQTQLRRSRVSSLG